MSALASVDQGQELDDEDGFDDGNVNESYAVRVVKRLKQEERQTMKRDHSANLDVIPGISVNCERLFSLVKHILTDTRKRTTPILFEAFLFLSEL